MTVLEQRYMERMPNILSDLVDELKKMNANLKEISEKLDKKEDSDE